MVLFKDIEKMHKMYDVLTLIAFNNIRILGSVKVPLREVVHNGRQSGSQALTGKHGEKLRVSQV